MPPKRRQNRPADPDPSRRASPPRRDQPPHEDEEEEEELDDDPTALSPPFPFYNTTFSAHRVSPLYLGNQPLIPPRLQLLAQRLRDTLVGDVIRGVEIGSAAAAAASAGGDDDGSTTIGRAGALERVEIQWVSVSDVLGISPEEAEAEANASTMEEEEDDAGVADSRRLAAAQLPGKKALHIALRYELASCTALLLPPLLPGETGDRSAVDGGETRFAVGGGAAADEMDWERTVDPTHFLNLPLLLLRMPAPLKTVIGDFLSTTFDCRVSPMRLGTRSLVHSWEAWIKSAGLPTPGVLGKDVVLTLGFYIPPSSAAPSQPSADGDAITDGQHQQPLGLKSIEVIIPAAELKRFVAAGKRLVKPQNKPSVPTAGWEWEHDLKTRRRLAGRLYEEGWGWRSAPTDAADGYPVDQPFTEALACYLKEHLALNLFHPGVRVTRIGCGGFAMSETRLKLFAPAGSEEANGGGLSWLGQRGAVFELLARLAEKAQVQKVTA